MVEGTQRRLAAIVSADVVGYSRLMGVDETGTLDSLRKHRAELIDPLIADHGGRIVKTMGDGLLLEFPSVVNAVKCSIEVQLGMVERNAEVADDRRVVFRVGVNLGDIVIEGDDIHGDGVNVAARLQEASAAGGICISSVVYESLGNRIDAAFADAGDREFKNITRRIRVYHWSPDAEPPLAERPSVNRDGMPDRTIAISSFDNLTGDPELGYLCEGVAEDIAAAIGNVGQLTVVSDAHILDPARAPRFLLTGGVRKAGDRIRIAARLVDRETGIQRWADRFDRDTGDLFEVQDEITRKIVVALHTELGPGVYTRHWQWETNNFEAWQLVAQGFREFQKFSPDSMAKTIAYWERAAALDGDSLVPLIGNGFCHSFLALISEGEIAGGHIAKARAIIDRAMAEAPEDVRTYSALRGLEIALGNFAAAVAAAETALNMNPGDAACRATYALALMSDDRPSEALAQITKAKADMTDPPGWLSMAEIQCHYMLEDLSAALSAALETVARVPDFCPGPILAAALATELGLNEAVADMRKRALAMDPHFSARRFVRSQGLKNEQHGERLFRALVNSGLPE